MWNALEDLFLGNGPIRFVQQQIGLGHEGLFHWIGLLGDTWGIVLVVGLAFWLYGRKTAYAVLAAVALGAIVKLVMTMTFSVPRPSGEEIVVYEQLEIGSFPSGHVFQTLVPWGVLWVRERLPVLIPAVVIVLVGLSRLYLGVHYLGDVVFAVVFAIPFVWGFVVLWKRVQPWLAQRSLGFYAGLTVFAAAAVLASIFVWVDTARRWEILGLVLGVGGALLAEYRWLQYEPPDERKERAKALAIGLAGLLCFAAVSRYLPDTWKLAHLGVAVVLMLWTLLAAPALIQQIVPSQRGRPRQVASEEV